MTVFLTILFLTLFLTMSPFERYEKSLESLEQSVLRLLKAAEEGRIKFLDEPPHGSEPTETPTTPTNGNT
jgi:preprotein translocase subunit SecG